MRLKYYYKKHLRSLFLSKFIYWNTNQVIKLSYAVFQLGFKKEKLNYSLAYLFLFLITNIVPTHNIKFNVIRGKKKLVFGNLIVKLKNNFFFIFLEKLNTLYLPNLENWAGVLNNFNFKNQFFFFKTIKFQDFSIFPELDFLVNFNFSNLQSISKKWICYLFFFCFKNNYEFVTILRSLEFPINNKKN